MTSDFSDHLHQGRSQEGLGNPLKILSRALAAVQNFGGGGAQTLLATPLIPIDNKTFIQNKFFEVRFSYIISYKMSHSSPPLINPKAFLFLIVFGGESRDCSLITIRRTA